LVLEERPVGARGQARDPKQPGIPADDIQGIAPDRSGGAEQDDFFHPNRFQTNRTKK
jgi:hypothetical protein